MMPMLRLIEAGADVIAGRLVTGVVESVVLLLATGLLVRLLPGLNATIRAAIWTGVLVMVVALPVAPMLLPTHDVAATGSRVGEIRFGEIWGLVLAALWCVISATRLGGLLRSAVRLRGMVRRAMPVQADARCAAILEAGRRRAVLCISADVDRPSVVGFFRPRVLLPEWLMDELHAEELEQIVRHEMEHLHRWDDWTNLLQKAALAIFPLNPVLVWLDRRLSLERELACDDGVLRQTRAPKTYAMCLATLAETTMVRKRTMLALGAWGRPSELARRVHRILAWSESGMSRRMATAVTLAVLALVTAGMTTMASRPQLVRFAAAPSLPEMANQPSREGDVLAASSGAGPFAADRPMLVKAAMPVPARVVVRGVHPAAMRHRRRPQRLITAVARADGSSVHGTGSWVMTTAWTAAEAPAKARLVSAEQGEFPRYAAVATRDGWLIFEL